MPPRLIIITGAAGVLGRATSQAFSGEAQVLVDLTTDSLQRAYGANTSLRRQVSVDLLEAAATRTALRSVLAEFPDTRPVLCNIAGGFVMGTEVHDTDDTVWTRMLRLNLDTLLHASGAVIPAMLARGYGKVVNVAAAAAFSGKAQMGAYVAAKSAVARVTESMSQELRGRGINVNAVAPSIIDTPANRAAMPDANPAQWVAPQDLANVMRFLASDEAVAVHGAVLPVVGLS